MPNVHLKEAARNIRQAISDMNLKIQEIRTETENQVRAAEARLAEIKMQQGRVSAQMAMAETDLQRTSQSNQIKDLEQEAAAIRKQITSLRDEQARAERDLNGQKADLDGLARRLELNA